MNFDSFCFDDVARAHEQIGDVAYRTPVFTSAMANDWTGGEVFFKCENFQRTGAFKFRGAYSALSRLTPEQRSRGVATFSGGNHAQGIALAGRMLGIRAVVAMPSDAPAGKVAATRCYGGEVVFYDRYGDDREALERRLTEQRGLTLVPSFDHPHVMAGQGTAAKELMEEVGQLDVLIAPLGGGGLLAGCAAAVQVLNRRCAVIGVEPESANDGQQSLRRGEIVHIDVPSTIADGARTQHLGKHTFPVIRQHVADIVTVSDAELVHAMKFFACRMKMVVEPTGCLAAAAILGHHLDLQGKRVGVMVSGGNVDLDQFAALISSG